MASFYRWVVVRSLLLFFLICLLPLILLMTVFMTLLLTSFHLILPHVLRQSPSKIPLHLPEIYLVVYLPRCFHWNKDAYVIVVSVRL